MEHINAHLALKVECPLFFALSQENAMNEIEVVKSFRYIPSIWILVVTAFLFASCTRGTTQPPRPKSQNSGPRAMITSADAIQIAEKEYVENGGSGPFASTVET